MPSQKKPVEKKAPRKKKETLVPVSELDLAPETVQPAPEPVQLSETSINVPLAPVEETSPIYRHPERIILIALALGWLCDFLFWGASLGVNFPVFMALGLVGGIIWLALHDLRPKTSTLWLVPLFVFFAAVTFLRTESLTRFLAFTFTLFSLGLIANTYLGGRWYQYGLLDYLLKFAQLGGGMVIGLLEYFSKVRKAEIVNTRTRNLSMLWGILRGLVFALPIVVCFASLLAAGDLVFEEKLGEFLGLFRVDNLVEYIFRLVLIFFYAYVLVGVFYHAASRSRDEKLLGEEKPIFKPFLGFSETAVILLSVSVLFLSFVVVQFQYFFGGQTNIGIEGYTYSQYARRGFNELITVAFFSLVLILGLNPIAKREGEPQKRIFSFLSVVVVLLVAVILTSAYQRISLAIDWHGFSRLRLYPRVFLIWLGILLLVIAALEVMRKERWFALAAVLASFGFALTLTLVNVDAAIVRHNIPRTLTGKNLNVAHLASLSPDAVPALAEAFYSKAYSQTVHEGIGAALTCYLMADDQYEETLQDWRSFSVPIWRAHQALQSVERHLQDYGIDDDKAWDVKVRTPGNVWYECDYYSGAEEE